MRTYIVPLELVEAAGLWHQIASHWFEYAAATNHNITRCGLSLDNPPYRGRRPFEESSAEAREWEALPKCQECIDLPPFWGG